MKPPKAIEHKSAHHIVMEPRPVEVHTVEIAGVTKQYAVMLVPHRDVGGWWTDIVGFAELDDGNILWATQRTLYEEYFDDNVNIVKRRIEEGLRGEYANYK